MTNLSRMQVQLEGRGAVKQGSWEAGPYIRLSGRAGSPAALSAVDWYELPAVEKYALLREAALYQESSLWRPDNVSKWTSGGSSMVGSAGAGDSCFGDGAVTGRYQRVPL